MSKYDGLPNPREREKADKAREIREELLDLLQDKSDDDFPWYSLSEIDCWIDDLITTGIHRMRRD